MRSIKKQHQPPHKPIILLAILFVLLAFGCYVLFFKPNRSQSTDTSTREAPTTTVNPSTPLAQNEPDTTEEPEPAKPSEPAPKTKTQQPKATTPEKATLELSTSQSTDAVTVHTKLSQLTTGTCTLSIQSAGSSHTETAPIMFQPEYSICSGFEIAKSKLDEGTWTISVTASYKQTKITKTITLEVS